MTDRQFKEASIKTINFYLENGLSEKDIEGIVWGMIGTYNAKFCNGGSYHCSIDGIRKIYPNGRIGGKMDLRKIFE